MKHQSGFTLLELMITVSVAAILLAVGIPGLQEFVRNNRRAAEINNLISTLQIARSEAVARNQRIGVCPSTDPASATASCSGNTTWETGWIVFIDTDDDGIRDAGENVLRVGEGPQSMTVRAEINALAYRPNGRAKTYPNPGNNTPGNFMFCDARGAASARVVQLPITGRPQSASKKIGGSSPSCP